MRTNTVTIIAATVMLITFLTRSLLAKSYLITSLLSNVYIENGVCTMNIVEYFEYEFVGSHSRIGRALPSQVNNAYDQSVTLLSNNGYMIRSEYATMDMDPYIVIYFTPPTPEGGTTRISFKLSYTVSSTMNLFKHSYDPNYYQASYYYKDNSVIERLNTTIWFSSDIDFSNPPDSEYQGVVRFISNQYSVFYSNTHLDGEFKPQISFQTISHSFDKCTPSLSDGDYVGIVLGCLAGLLLNISIPLYVMLKRFGFCIRGREESGGEESETNYSSFNDNNYSSSNDCGGGGGGSSYHHGGSGFAD